MMFNAEESHILVTILIGELLPYRHGLTAGYGCPGFCRFRTGGMHLHQPPKREKLLCAVAPTFLHAQCFASRERKRGFVKEVTANFNIKEIEREVQAYWRTHDTYKAVRQHRSTGKPFFFVDGPPYTTGHIHIGTAWNKILKDSILRYHRMNGRHVIDRAGYDMHGLPIEVKVEQALGFAVQEGHREVRDTGVHREVPGVRGHEQETDGRASSRASVSGWISPVRTRR